MALDAFTNLAISTLTAGITNVATTFNVTAGQGARFPAGSFNATIWNVTDYAAPDLDPNVEIVRCSVATDTFTITRAQEGTAAVAHNTGGKTYMVVAGMTALTANNLPAKDLTPRILASSGTPPAVASSSLTEVNFGNILIPAGLMGLNGRIELRCFYQFTGVANTKTILVRHTTASGSTSGGTVLITNAMAAGNLSAGVVRDVWNAGSASAQISYAVSRVDSGAAGTAGVTGTINTASDSYLNLNGFVTTGGDSIRVMSYSVVFYPGV